MENLCKGDYFKTDIKKMEWMLENYKETNIADSIHKSLSSFLGRVKMKKYAEKFKKLDEIEKAIGQDTKKMLLSAKKIYDYSMMNENVKGELIRKNNGYDEIKDSVQINMEYYIYKYRVIVEYILKIVDCLIDMDIKAYCEEKNIQKRLNQKEIGEIKVDYICKIVKQNGDGMFDKEWLDSIRIVRNKLVHEGASCVIFDNGDEPLFQVYNLDVDDLLNPNDFVSNGRLISCKYFISVTVPELIYFVEVVKKALESAPKSEKATFAHCSLNYDIIEKTQEQEIVDEIWDRCGYEKYIPIYQETYLKMIEKYCALK